MKIPLQPKPILRDWSEGNQVLVLELQLWLCPFIHLLRAFIFSTNNFSCFLSLKLLHTNKKSRYNVNNLPYQNLSSLKFPSKFSNFGFFYALNQIIKTYILAFWNKVILFGPFMFYTKHKHFLSCFTPYISIFHQ